MLHVKIRFQYSRYRQTGVPIAASGDTRGATCRPGPITVTLPPTPLDTTPNIQTNYRTTPQKHYTLHSSLSPPSARSCPYVLIRKRNFFIVLSRVTPPVGSLRAPAYRLPMWWVRLLLASLRYDPRRSSLNNLPVSY